jgi:hypothetical protein
MGEGLEKLLKALAAFKSSVELNHGSGNDSNQPSCFD